MQSRKWLALVLPLAMAAAYPGFASAADQPAAAAEQSHEHERHHGDPMQHAQKRLERLKADLKITPEQEGQWTAFTDAVMQQMQQFKTAHEGMKSMPTKAPERIDREVEMMKQRTASFETIAQAAKKLYSALTPDQQQIADQHLLNFHHERPKG